MEFNKTHGYVISGFFEIEYPRVLLPDIIFCMVGLDNIFGMSKLYNTEDIE
jgi:hypothetical protein